MDGTPWVIAAVKGRTRKVAGFLLGFVVLGRGLNGLVRDCLVLLAIGELVGVHRIQDLGTERHALPLRLISLPDRGTCQNMVRRGSA